MNRQKITEYLQYEFTDEEKLALGPQLARMLAEKANLERRKSEVAKSLSGEIEAKQIEIDKLTGMVSTGYEWRHIQCEIYLNTPQPGLASIVRTDTGEVVKHRRMTDEELQFKLPLTPPEEPAAEEEMAPAACEAEQTAVTPAEETAAAPEAVQEKQGLEPIKEWGNTCGNVKLFDDGEAIHWRASVMQNAIAETGPCMTVQAAIADAHSAMLAAAGKLADALTDEEFTSLSALLSEIEHAGNADSEEQK